MKSVSIRIWILIERRSGGRSGSDSGKRIRRRLCEGLGVRERWKLKPLVGALSVDLLRLKL